jgi:DnaJ-class molecular chaperone
MKRTKLGVVEEQCPSCNGTGVIRPVKQPAPGRRIYPPRCTQCEGKGRITKSTDLNKKAIP